MYYNIRYRSDMAQFLFVLTLYSAMVLDSYI